MSWLISSGDYSDYRVDAVCPSKEVAEAVVAFINANDLPRNREEYRVEERPDIVDPSMVKRRVAYGTSISVFLGDERSPANTREHEWLDLDWTFDGSEPRESSWTTGLRIDEPRPGSSYRQWVFNAHGDDLTRCWKLVRDAHAKWLAERQGL